MPFPVIGLFELGAKIIDKIIPDPAAKMQAQLDLLRLQQAGEFKEIDAQLQLSQMQSNVNQVEAGNASLFVSGWRPAIGWACGAIFVANYIGAPLLAWLSPLLHIPPPPRLDIGEVLPVLIGMLGLGGLHMNEKLKGVA